MNREEILDTIKMLARSQGMYGRILEAIEEMDEWEAEEFWQELEDYNFGSTFDIVMFFES